MRQQSNQSSILTGSDIRAPPANSPRVPFSWVMNDGSARMLRLNSRPLPVPVDVGASFRAAVTA